MYFAFFKCIIILLFICEQGDPEISERGDCAL